jgi:hypothetical protein
LQHGRTALRYFLDTEYNGWGGALISLALVPEDDGEELYVVVECPDPIENWVQRHVLPYLNMVPDALKSAPVGRGDAAALVAHYLAGDPFPEIVADWPEDIALLSALLVTGPAMLAEIERMAFRFERLPGFSTAASSAVPHNALHDARALRDHILSLE